MSYSCIHGVAKQDENNVLYLYLVMFALIILRFMGVIPSHKLHTDS